MNIIDQIKAEILRLIETDGAQVAIGKVLTILDTLQEQPVCEGLEEMAEGIVCSMINESSAIGVPNDHIPSWVQDAMIQSCKAGAKWQKEQMMKEAVEGEVVKDINNKLAVTAKNVNLDGFKFGEKVRIIIVKED